ncbi:unnamed protein product [Blepharisma stoltei]|uniref:Uncharacterized protein n=1 Tax=Blepharisma stoltei TaxID=1481888 RepID=A0AAU9IKE7_9CILI|nr:unnamed protein product [Blepharisma stoltei]
MHRQISNSEYFKSFAYSVLLPLHKVQTVILFHKFLMKCCRKYQRINNEFVNSWIEAIVRYWPYGNSSKELLFLNELDEALKLGKEIISINIWELAWVAFQNLQNILLADNKDGITSLKHSDSCYPRAYLFYLVGVLGVLGSVSFHFSNFSSNLHGERHY